LKFAALGQCVFKRFPSRFGARYRFVVVGAVGFLTDTLVFLYLLEKIHNPYFSKLAAFFGAVCITFLLNRYFTFKVRKKSRPMRYLISQLLGAAINMLVFSLVIWKPFWLPLQYYLGLILGAFVAMVFNFEMSRRYVFV
jgi:putative flippase GtrA